MFSKTQKDPLGKDLKGKKAPSLKLHPEDSKDESSMKQDKAKQSEVTEKASHLKHDQLRISSKHKLITNDLAYFLHHPQVEGPKGPKLPPKQPKDK